MIKNIGLIDCDVLVYRSCYKSAKEGISIITVFDDILDHIQRIAACDDYEIHLSGKGNFRKEVNPGFANEYKGKRKSKPEGYELLRDYILNNHDTITVPMFEADDTIAISTNRIRQTDDMYTIISVDKDLIQLGGFVFNTTTQARNVYSLEEGCHFFNKQLLMGDAVDNIEGVYGIGKAKVEKLFKGKDLRGQLASVIRKYKLHHKDDWQTRLEYNGTLLWLKRSYDEPHWTIKSHIEYMKTIQK